MTWEAAVIMALHFLKVDPGYEMLRLKYVSHLLYLIPHSRFKLKNISQVSRVLRTIIPLLEIALKKCVGDPNRRPPPHRRLRLLDEQSFFCDVEHIGDCTLMSTDRAHHHELDRWLYSVYLPGHKGKVLIVCGADGNVLFVSRVYASSMSEEDIVLDSGWLDHVRAGEHVLYDKGATDKMRDRIQAQGATLITPSYVVKGHLTHSEVLHSTMVARARVVIENVNER